MNFLKGPSVMINVKKGDSPNQSEPHHLMMHIWDEKGEEIIHLDDYQSGSVVQFLKNMDFTILTQGKTIVELRWKDRLPSDSICVVCRDKGYNSFDMRRFNNPLFLKLINEWEQHFLTGNGNELSYYCACIYDWLREAGVKNVQEFLRGLGNEFSFDVLVARLYKGWVNEYEPVIKEGVALGQNEIEIGGVLKGFIK